MTDLEQKLQRYQRQTCLDEVKPSGQHTLLNAHIVIIGIGGLGCPVSQYLASSGIGQLTLVDADTVDESNLPRQILFDESQLGQYKVRCAKDKLTRLNRHCRIHTFTQALNPDNVSVLCQGADIILDCADNFATSYILSDYCYTNKLPLISASALGFSGYVGGYCGGKPSIRALFPDLPKQAQNCSSAGVMGPVVGTLGAIQAQFTLNTLLATTPSPLGQMLSLDLRSMHQSSFRFDHAAEPQAGDTLIFIGQQQLKPSDWIVDLRTELTTKTHSNNVQIMSIDDFLTRIPTPPHAQRAVLVCKTGLRAWRAARELQVVWQGDIKVMAVGDNPIHTHQITT